MSLRSVMVDRGRTIGATQTNYRVQGMTIVEETTGPWFRCRLTLPEANPDESMRRRRTIVHPTLLYPVKDSAGNAIVLTIDMRIEVDSPELGRTVWLVENDPSPLRKKRRVIGFETHLKRADSHPAERQHTVRSPVGASVGLPSEVTES